MNKVGLIAGAGLIGIAGLLYFSQKGAAQDSGGGSASGGLPMIVMSGGAESPSTKKEAASTSYVYNVTVEAPASGGLAQTAAAITAGNAPVSEKQVGTKKEQQVTAPPVTATPSGAYNIFQHPEMFRDTGMVSEPIMLKKETVQAAVSVGTAALTPVFPAAGVIGALFNFIGGGFKLW
jgi:hypothetical protein